MIIYNGGPALLIAAGLTEYLKKHVFDVRLECDNRFGYASAYNRYTLVNAGKGKGVSKIFYCVGDKSDVIHVMHWCYPIDPSYSYAELFMSHSDPDLFSRVRELVNGG